MNWLQPAHGDQVACEGMFDKTNYCKARSWTTIASNFSTPDRLNV